MLACWLLVNGFEVDESSDSGVAIKSSQNRGMTPDFPPGIGKNATLESWESGDQLLQLNFQGWSREDFSNHDVLIVKN
jgi:hypothetical protein